LENRDHPRDKLDVGYRLSRAGLAVAYGFKNVTYQGPIIAHISVSSDSTKVNVTYSTFVSTSIELRNSAGFEVYLVFFRFIKKDVFCRYAVEAKKFAARMIQCGYQL